MMQKSWFLVGVFMGWDSRFRCVSTEKWCFSYITLHPQGVIHNTTGFILLKPRPTRRTFSGWKRTCRSWEVTYWVWPTSQLATRTTKETENLPCDMSFDFPFRGPYHGVNVPGAKHLAPWLSLFLFLLRFACAIRIAPFGGRGKNWRQSFIGPPFDSSKRALRSI